MNVSNDHLPMSIIVYTVVPARNIPIAPPEPFECVPTSSGPNPSFSVPNSWTIALSFTNIREDGIVYVSDPNFTKFICVSLILSSGIP